MWHRREFVSRHFFRARENAPPRAEHAAPLKKADVGPMNLLLLFPAMTTTWSASSRPGNALVVLAWGQIHVVRSDETPSS